MGNNLCFVDNHPEPFSPRLQNG